MKEFKVYIGHSFTYQDSKGYNRKALIQEDRIDTFIACAVPDVFPDGFTVYRATGQWEGGSEPCTVIEAVAEDTALGKVTALAWKAAARFDQKAVMLTAKTVDIVRLIGPGYREDK